jgi:hypothetical protein
MEQTMINENDFGSDYENDYEGESDTYDNYIVKKSTVRYKFIIVLFLLSMFIFNPNVFDFVKDNLEINDTNILLLLHSTIYVSIIYIMLVYSDDSYIFSPCNIELDMDDYLYYENKKY